MNFFINEIISQEQAMIDEVVREFAIEIFDNNDDVMIQSNVE